MAPSITLIEKGRYGDEVSSLVLPLSTARSGYSVQDKLEIVYQDISYEYRISGLDASLMGSYVTIFINNNEIALKREALSVDDDGFSISFTAKDTQPSFARIYGITDIIVSFKSLDKSESVFFSGYLAVAIRENTGNELEASVVSMLDDIYQKDHHLLYSNKQVSKDVCPNLLKFGENKYDEEISLLSEIILAFRRLLPNFIHSPRTNLKTDSKIDSFEKLHTVGNQNLIYITTHPELLKPSSGTFGITVGKQRLFPEKTLVSTNIFSYDTVENRGVLSFIYTLLRNSEQKKLDIIRLLSTEQHQILADVVIREGYILSSSVIRQYTEIAFKRYLNQYEKIVEQLSDLFSQYQRILPCSQSYLAHPPSPTPAFLEMYHYRKIFEFMNIWFGKSDIQLPSRNPLLHFSSADRIYEYYCLLHICDVLVMLGFVEQIDKRTCYQYSAPDWRFKGSDIDNTYYFQKENCKVTLYYQPVVYSDYSMTTNGIDLFRTDTNYYSPDFILKKEDDTGVKYGILDAKWRKMSELQRHYWGGELPDTAYKYVYSILERESLQSVPFCWLMNGKDDVGSAQQNKIYFHRQGKISTSIQGKLSPDEYRKFKYATGIVPLTPTSGHNGLLEILQAFLT